MRAKSKIVVYGETDHGLDIWYDSTRRVNSAIDDLLDFLHHGTPIYPGSDAVNEFVAAVAMARGQSLSATSEPKL